MGNSQGQVSVIKSLNPALHLFEAPSKYFDPLQAELPFVFFTEVKKGLCPNRIIPLRLPQPKLLG